MNNIRKKRLIIVGGAAGGASAAARARRLPEDSEIIMFERGAHVSFANCGLPYFVGGEIAEQDSLLVQTPDSLKARFNLDVHINTEVIRIDRTNQRAHVRESETGREYAEAYHALLLSTGASPLKSGQRLSADTVILGLGVKPETGLAKDAGLELGKLDGRRVNGHLQTSDPQIWAVGDAIEARDGVTGHWALTPLAGPANRQGRIAPDSILGRPSKYQQTWGTAILRLFKPTAGCTGANEKSLRGAEIPFRTIHLYPGSHADYCPGAEPIAQKIQFASNTSKLLGAQAIGHDGVDKRIDVLATGLKAGLTVHDLAELELAYAPPYGSAKDPVNLAGMAAQNVLDGYVALAQWNEPASLGPDTTLLLDVRRPDERARGFIPGSMHFPLDELRQRLNELPRDREIIAYCQSGQRSYNAARILSQRGFHATNLSGGYTTFRHAAAATPR